MKSLPVYRARFDALEVRVAEQLGRVADPEARALAAFRILDDELARVPRAIACRAGCSHCCHVHVEATEPEIAAIAHHLERTLSPTALAALRRALGLQVARVRELSDDERWAARVPCALLDGNSGEGHCTVYPVRPLRCRAFHSLSRVACRDAFDGTSTDAPDVDRVVAKTADAVEAGYDAARGPGNTLLLEAGLWELLEKSANALL